MQDEKILIELARLILPSGFIENFKIVSITSNVSDIEISLDEFDVLPDERKEHRTESKGFLDAVTVRDFPLRDKRVNLRYVAANGTTTLPVNTLPTPMTPSIRVPAIRKSLRLF